MNSSCKDNKENKIIVEELTENQSLWFCTLELKQVTFARKDRDDRRRVVVLYPPDDIQTFAKLSELHLTRQSAIDMIMKRIESSEDTLVVSSKSMDHMHPFFDSDTKNFAFKQLISSMNERLARLELSSNSA